MADFPSMPFFTDAYLADTTHLTREEHGAYLLLLIASWRTAECRLRDDDLFLARVVKASLSHWQKSLRPIMLGFWVIEDGFWTQKKQRAIRQHVESVSKKRSSLGKTGGIASARAKALGKNDTGQAIGSDLLEQTPSKVQASKSKSSSLRSEDNTPPSLTSFEKPPLAAEPPPQVAPVEPPEPKPKIPKPRKTREGTRIPDDWQLTDKDYDFARTMGLADDRIQFEAGKFKDHWLQSDRDTAWKRCWSAAWRTWVRGEVEQIARSRGPSGGGGVRDRNAGGPLTRAYERTVARRASAGEFGWH